MQVDSVTIIISFYIKLHCFFNLIVYTLLFIVQTICYKILTNSSNSLFDHVQVHASFYSLLFGYISGCTANAAMCVSLLSFYTLLFVLTFNCIRGGSMVPNICFFGSRILTPQYFGLIIFVIA